MTAHINNITVVSQWYSDWQKCNEFLICDLLHVHIVIHTEINSENSTLFFLIHACISAWQWHIHHFHGHFPHELEFASCPWFSLSLTLRLYMHLGQAQTLHIILNTVQPSFQQNTEQWFLSADGVRWQLSDDKNCSSAFTNWTVFIVQLFLADKNFWKVTENIFVTQQYPVWWLAEVTIYKTDSVDEDTIKF